MISENIYAPYFYIIRHIKTGKMYAGSRYAKGCHPDEFMKLNGYTTSSVNINNIIEQEGIGAFEILRIDTNCDGIHPHDYETSFLRCIDCASSDNWLNGHNNNLFGYGSKGFIKSMQLKYGVDNPGQLDYVKKINSENMKQIVSELISSNCHFFQNSDFQRNIQKKLVQEGRHNFMGEKASKKISERNKKMVENGTHPFLGGEVQTKMNNRRVENGTHPFLGGEVQRITQNKLVAEGRHHSQTEQFSRNQSERQQKLVSNGTHHFLSGEIQSNHNKLMILRSIYKYVKGLYEILQLTKPKCLHRKSNEWLYVKYEELITIQEYRNERT